MSGPLEELEVAACIPHPVHADDFNIHAEIPYGCTTQHVYLAMNEFINFLGFINQQLHTQGIQRFESMLMPANFSSVVVLLPLLYVTLVIRK